MPLTRKNTVGIEKEIEGLLLLYWNQLIPPAINPNQKEEKNMQKKYSKKIEVNKAAIEFADKKMAAYGGFSWLTAIAPSRLFHMDHQRIAYSWFGLPLFPISHKKK
jgi:hypothetical protein